MLYPFELRAPQAGFSPLKLPRIVYRTRFAAVLNDRRPLSCYPELDLP
jgi:hypothetical protein